MPELPEVETILRGIQPHVEHQCIRTVLIRQRRLRWEIPPQIERELQGQNIKKLSRRGKYLLFETTNGTAIFHFGMSGSLRLLQKTTLAGKHDHVELHFDDFILRYTDPRRFGAFLWTKEDPGDHPLLAHLGVEPLTEDLTGNYLYLKSRTRKLGIKQFIMNSSIVVGIGNIYAVESLFLAKIDPQKSSHLLSLEDFERLCAAIKKVLAAAIHQGGTTLRDFLDTSGQPGYFKQKLYVYGREGLPCQICKTPLTNIRIQNRATVFCSRCQH